MKIAVVVFPGSNADFDALHVARDVLGEDARYVFHKETASAAPTAVIVPGGLFVRRLPAPGAIARYSPDRSGAVAEFAERGGPVLGICNGFQILTEAGLLPGALTRNSTCASSAATCTSRSRAHRRRSRAMLRGAVLRMPIAHAEGRYSVRRRRRWPSCEGDDQIVFRYCDAARPRGQSNPRNGSLDRHRGRCTTRKKQRRRPHAASRTRAAKRCSARPDGMDAISLAASACSQVQASMSNCVSPKSA